MRRASAALKRALITALVSSLPLGVYLLPENGVLREQAGSLACPQRFRLAVDAAAACSAWAPVHCLAVSSEAALSSRTR